MQILPIVFKRSLLTFSLRSWHSNGVKKMLEITNPKDLVFSFIHVCLYWNLYGSSVTSNPKQWSCWHCCRWSIQLLQNILYSFYSISKNLKLFITYSLSCRHENTPGKVSSTKNKFRSFNPSGLPSTELISSWLPHYSPQYFRRLHPYVMSSYFFLSANFHNKFLKICHYTRT